MAELGAHLISNNLERPSIFELVAASSLDSTFYPALKRIANVSFIMKIVCYEDLMY